MLLGVLERAETYPGLEGKSKQQTFWGFHILARDEPLFRG